ncbi:uncharacterized protein LOC115624884 isoform X2 [Scaptodrosophila lebanonensis]|uniref:Uncharacterized protein LOC115624884 isoform X2 n=1 Tax=Drosophila lebanonensis TaxID=7225 RepID=A0A6J2TFT0_DROLE|nr:uncharacterized protein LOC115624884 isoform X2 [Scaptodrosophila lebanonensis]
MPIKSEALPDSVTRSGNNNSKVNLTNIHKATGAVPKQATASNTIRTRSGCGLVKQQVQQQTKQLEVESGQNSTEPVQPLQRKAFKTLNDFLLSTVAQQQACISNSQDELPPAALSSNSSPKERQLRQRDTADQNYDSSDNLPEFQRYCFPVRPVQRVQHQQTQPQLATALPLRQTTSPNATVGVVIPNTFNGIEDQTPTGLQILVNRLIEDSRPDAHATRAQVEVLRALLGLDENWNNSVQQHIGTEISDVNSMVHEINPAGDQGVVNSTSLEDVVLSEVSDNRAQSIQSLHSVVETPTPGATPEATPSFEELEQRLELSNRNMQHLQNEQAKLLHIQNLAKTHLNEMEQLRQQAGSIQTTGAEGTPNYESVHQVQDDMASLVGRMKNLTVFIHSQNELSNVLGDDGPEIIAEQQALQQKLEALRAQREDMRNLVDELNNINRTAKETAVTMRSSLESVDQERLSEEGNEVNPVESKERTVPVEYQRNVPILRQEAANAAQRALQAQALINQKTADIDALKSQMARLKSMLNTVNQIDDSTPCIGQTLDNTRHSSTENQLPANKSGEILQRVHALNDVTSELRAEAANLQHERDRILALKAEVERRKHQAASAAQLGEQALQRNSLTPTPTLASHQTSERPKTPSPTREELRAQCERLKKQYEQKQREYEARYKTTKTQTNRQKHYTNTTSEADDECNDDTDSGKYFNHARTSSSAATLKRVPSTATVVEQQRNHSKKSQSLPHNEDDLNVTMDSLSLGNDSLQSGSTRMQYMPPPMAPVQASWATHNANNTWQAQPMFGQTRPHSSSNGGEYLAYPSSNASTATQAQPGGSNSESVLLQQFMQTQQMLINSVCQCNQSLWHQQREIDNLNNLIHVLQDRVNAANDQSFGLRSESVPPSSLTVAAGLNSMPNNLCMDSNRAQSEQLFSFGAHNSAFSNYQQRHRNVSIYHQANLNNSAPPPPPPPPPSVPAAQTVGPVLSPPTHFNNEIPHSPPSYRTNPGPIFMNHHNNTIHQNNANLRTQNQHANNVPLDISATPAALNNQVPPGNRANNYWDNFRSYSRQNLLSINSNKNNEEPELEQQQLHQLQQRGTYQHYQQLQPSHPRRHFHEVHLHGTSNNLNNSRSSRDWRADTNNMDVEEDNNLDTIIFSDDRRPNHRRLLPNLRDADANAHQQVSSNSLNMNINYGNSPLYQRNKVPAKPTTSVVALTPLQQRHLRFNFDLLHQQHHPQNFDYVPQFGIPMPEASIPVYNLTNQEPSTADESNENVLEQAEDTASEELNRNLLVNALKNDKFTTKFYESIKEDVYRRLETLFEQQQQQKQGDMNCLQKALNQAQDQGANPNELLQNGKLIEAELEMDSAINSTSENTGKGTEMGLPPYVENDKPEDENDPANPMRNRDEEHSQTHFEEPSVKNDEKLTKTIIEVSTPAPACMSPIEVRSDHELIKYIIKKIQHQTNNNTTINDAQLAEVSKLTVTAIQSSETGLAGITAATRPVISPKRIYAKIKKMDIPRQRNEFLLWYEKYLEQMFLVERPSTSYFKPAGQADLIKKCPKAASKKHPKELLRAQNSNDADLAEADQKVSPNGQKSDVECENKEIPEEEGAAAAISSIE